MKWNKPTQNYIAGAWMEIDKICMYKCTMYNIVLWKEKEHIIIKFASEYKWEVC